MMYLSADYYGNHFNQILNKEMSRVNVTVSLRMSDNLGIMLKPKSARVRDNAGVYRIMCSECLKYHIGQIV